MAKFLSLIAVFLCVMLISCVSFGDKERMRKTDYREFESWAKVNAEPLTGTANGLLQGKHLEDRGIREVYVNEVGEPSFSGNAELPLPVGTIIVKDTFYIAKDGLRGRRWNITVMKKRESGYDSENGDWEYITAGPRKGVRFQGIRPLCIECHILADRDFVFTWE